MYIVVGVSSDTEEVKRRLDAQRPSEFYLALGRRVRAYVRRGYSLNEIACRAGFSCIECLFALHYAESSEGLKLRAMVEDWPWPEIKQRVREQKATRAAPVQPQASPAAASPAVAEVEPDFDPAVRDASPLAVRPGKPRVRERTERRPSVARPRLGRPEARRRLWHMLPGLLPFVLALVPHQHPLSWDSLCKVALLATILTAGVLCFYRTIARAGETDRVLNIVSYPAVIVLMLLLFPAHPEFAGVVLTVLAFGDGSATLFGLLFGRRVLPWNRQKTWVGSLSFLLCAAPMAALAYWVESQDSLPFEVALVCGTSAALIGQIAESLPSTITDNLRVGVAAAVGVVAAHAAMTGWS